MKLSASLLALPLLSLTFVSCADKKEPEEAPSVTASKTRKKQNTPQSSYYGSQDSLPSQQANKYATRTDNPYGELPDAYETASDNELKSNSAPIDLPPSNVITPPKVD